MFIKPTRGHVGRTTLRAKQTAPKSTIDEIQFPSTLPHVHDALRKKAVYNNNRSFDYNVQGPLSSIAMYQA